MEGVLHVCLPKPQPVSVAELASPVTKWRCCGRLNHKFDRRQSRIILIFFRPFFHTKKGVISSRHQLPNRTRCVDLSISTRPTYFRRSRLGVGSLYRLNRGSSRSCLVSTGSHNIWTRSSSAASLQASQPEVVKSRASPESSGNETASLR